MALQLFVVFSVAVIAVPVHASDLSSPEERVILTVTGAIAQKNTEEAAVFDLAMLEALGGVSLKTETRWTEGLQEFEGVNIQALLEHLGATGNAVRAIAINDYAVTIPMADITSYNVIIAYRRNGKPMRVRDKGPLWIIYPWGDTPEVRSKKYYDRSIWQLKGLEVK
ncbi:MAG: molybdopterin-dependent oxidoreductase [Rhodospirillaceae bacterium]